MLIAVWMSTVRVNAESEAPVVVMLDSLARLVENEELVDTAVESVDSMPAGLGNILVLWHLVDEIERSVNIESE